MDGHVLRSIHDSRCFFTNKFFVDKITSQLEATWPVWKAWLGRANAFKNVNPSRSYTSVVQQNTSFAADRQVQIAANAYDTKMVKNLTKNICKNKPRITKDSVQLLLVFKNTKLLPPIDIQTI